jgi:hypothetical protein
VLDHGQQIAKVEKPARVRQRVLEHVSGLSL